MGPISQESPSWRKIWSEAIGTVLKGYYWNGISWSQVISDTTPDATKYTAAG